MSRLVALLLAVSVTQAATQGCVGTIAGVPLHAPIQGQPALLASLSLTSPATVDPSSPGTVLLPLHGNVMASGHGGTLHLLAGGGNDTTSSAAYATKASLQGSTFVATGPQGIVIADLISIRLFDKTGVLNLVAGSLNTTASAVHGVSGGRALGQPINPPRCVHADYVSGDVYMSDGSTVTVIRTTGPTAGLLSAVAGNGSSIFVESTLATKTGFADIRDVHSTPSGDLIVAMNDNFVHPRVIRVSLADGFARTIIGSHQASRVGSARQLADSAYFATGSPANTPIAAAISVCVLEDGRILFSDGRLIASLTSTGSLVVIAGTLPSLQVPIIDGSLASDGAFYRLVGIRRGSGPAEIIATDSGVVYRLNLETQRIHTIAGRVQNVQLTPALSRPGAARLRAIAIPLPVPYDVLVDQATGDIYAAVTVGNVIVRVSAADATMTVIAGTGTNGCDHGSGTNATLTDLSHPSGIALDGHGGLIIADRRCCLLRRLHLSTGLQQILAGL